MKLARYGAAGAEKPVMVGADGVLRDLSAHCADIEGALLSDMAALARLDPALLPEITGAPRLGPCVTGVGKFVCIGLNYSDHAAETGNSIPSEPVLFIKATSAICGPNDDVRIPKSTGGKLDYEVELGVIIGKSAKYVAEAEALDYVAGYCIVNDVSERALQIEREGQWTKGKSSDTFGPLGPWLVTKDEIPDPQNLGMRLDVNGERRQNGSTKTMIFGVAHLVSYLSTLFTLHPGDVISTGTPPGVAMGMKPPAYLSVGDVVTLSIDGLGEQRQIIAAD